MLTLGIYTFGTTCYGFIISVKESRGLLTVMAILLSVAFIGQLASVFTAMMLRTDLETELANTAKIADDMDKYALEDSTKANWDSLQSSLRCCGGKRYEFGFRSWDRVPINGTKGHHVPDSCCHEQTEGCGRGKVMFIAFYQMEFVAISIMTCNDENKERLERNEAPPSFTLNKCHPKQSLKLYCRLTKPFKHGVTTLESGKTGVSRSWR